MTSRILYTTAASIRAIKSEAMAAAEAKRPRYHLRAGLSYLHFSCLKLTDKSSEAWTGTVEQARACRRKFAATAGCKLRAITPKPPVYVEEVA